MGLCVALCTVAICVLAGLVMLAAGFGSTALFVDAPLTGELQMIAVNITAVTRLAHTFARRLCTRGRGGIVLFGSIVGWHGVPGQATYAATKAYVQSLAEGLHHELAQQGIDVLSVAPGPVHTGFEARAGLTLKSATTPDVVARAAVAALGRRTTIVPGFRGRFLTAALATLPRALRIRLLGAIIGSWRTPEPTQPHDTSPAPHVRSTACSSTTADGGAGGQPIDGQGRPDKSSSLPLTAAALGRGGLRLHRQSTCGVP
jgi:NAD(P)-dependent dehydrogenase (short-subunit alcohol dehydrogenase family)